MRGKKQGEKLGNLSLQSSCVLFSEFLYIIGSCNCLVWHERKLSNSGGIICCTVRASKFSTTAHSIPSALHQLKNGLSTMAIPEGICQVPEVLVVCFSCKLFPLAWQFRAKHKTLVTNQASLILSLHLCGNQRSLSLHNCPE